MPDRVEELVTIRNQIVARLPVRGGTSTNGEWVTFWRVWELVDTADELATIAREANARADEAELALAAEREVSATYARVGDEMKARGEARIKELEGERDTFEAIAKWLAEALGKVAYGDNETKVAACYRWFAAAREAVHHEPR